MAHTTISGTQRGQRRLNGPQTTGRSYRDLSEPQYTVILEANQRVPMRDGTTLLADVLRPDAHGRFPALVAASPYPRQIQNSGAPLGFVEAGASDFFVPRGYVHVLANARGTGGSGGTYDFYGPTERRDMYDLVEWAAAQPWCDGKVGMIGISAFAVLQLEAAVEQPPHLRAIFPVATSADLYEAIYHGGLLSATFTCGWLKGVGTLAGLGDKQLRGPLMQLAERILRNPLVHDRLQHFNGEAALAVLGKLIPARFAPQPWGDLFVAVAVEHQTKDEFWRQRDLISLLHRVRVPVYLGCDWANVPMHLASTFAALAALPAAVPVRVALLEPGDLSWPWEGLHVEALAWFDQWLRGRDTGVMEGPPIRYCLPGEADGWRTATAWPPPGTRHVPLHLTVDGALLPEEGPPGVRSYLYLPERLARTPLGAAAGPSALLWESQPLPAALDMAGPAELVLEAATTAIDTAWIATLQDVAPDGQVTDVTAGWLRGSLRAVDEARSSPGRPAHPYDTLEPIVPNARVTYRIGLVDNARRFLPGHRIRLVLTSDDTAGPAMMGFRHAPLGLAARNSVYSASRLLLPVLAGVEALVGGR